MTTSKTPDRQRRQTTPPKPNTAVAAEMRSLRAQLYHASNRADVAERALEGTEDCRYKLASARELIGDLLAYIQDPSSRDICALLHRVNESKVKPP